VDPSGQLGRLGKVFSRIAASGSLYSKILVETLLGV
jgi:hypothetical protein